MVPLWSPRIPANNVGLASSLLSGHIFWKLWHFLFLQQFFLSLIPKRFVAKKAVYLVNKKPAFMNKSGLKNLSSKVPVVMHSENCIYTSKQKEYFSQ